jgi:GNAT superfamily N-acetyltransferase
MNMDTIIRPAAAGDLPFLAEHDRHIAVAELDNAIRLCRVLLLETAQGMPIGWLRWNLFWDNTPFMNLLYVLEPWRGRGVGRALVEAWERQSVRFGYAVVMTSTQANEYAQHFYTHLGYCAVGGFALPGDDYELIFAKELKRE